MSETKQEIKKRVYEAAKAKYKRAGARVGKLKNEATLKSYYAAKADYQKKGEALRLTNQRAKASA